MSNYKFKLLIKPEEISNNLLPEQKNLFNNVQIIKTELLGSGEVEIDCLALVSEVLETSCRQIMTFSKNEYIAVKDI